MQVASEPPVLILTGPPGAGKTSAAAILAERAERAVHLEADAFFRFIRAGYVQPWKPESHDQNSLVMDIVAEVATSYAAAGYFTVVDGIVIPRWFLGPLRDRLRAAGLGVAYAAMRAPLSICEARLRERKDFFDADAIVRLWQAFEDLGELEGNAVDVAGLGPDEAADVIARALEDGRLTV